MSSSADSDDLKNQVARVLEAEICPALQRNGAAIEVLDVQDGIVRVRLRGSCQGCPSAILAVIMGVEQELRKRIPQVQYLEAVP